jgi:chorismate mutase
MIRKQPDIHHPSLWLPTVAPILIAGPCGAESEEQVMETAAGISAIEDVKIFRAGIWKPRTRPNAFEGIGEAALPWLQRVKKEFGLLTCVEVANAQHVEKALKYGVDILWIGARTTVNPFSVQEIADAVRGTRVPVMVKNPIHPELQLWIGAIERINQAGINQLIAVHRGFYNVNKTQFRNDPQWELAIELRTIFPELPLICDPSHIAGKRDLIKKVAQRAIDLGMDGLMIETHTHPEQALSDAAQQITPTQLKQLLSKELVFRKSRTEDKEFADKLTELRHLIDDLDADLMTLLGRRKEIIEKIGQYKKEKDITIFQLQRWMEILKTRSDWAAEKGIDRIFIEKMCQLMHEESIRLQNEILNKGQ